MKSIAAFLAGSALMFSANAATVSFNFTNGLATTEIHQSGSLGLFNTSLGTLTGVSMQFTGEQFSSFSLTNNNTVSGNLGMTLGTGFFFGSSISALDALLAGPIPFLSTSVTASANVAAGATQSFGPSDVTALRGLTGALTAIESNFEIAGNGNFLVSCFSQTSTSVSGVGNISSTTSNKADCGASIQYTYTPLEIVPPTTVPEPATLALVGFALAGLAASRRRKI